MNEIEIVYIYPDILSTYGDRGNCEILKYLFNQYGVSARIIYINYGDGIPISSDIYIVGGGEDKQQILASRNIKNLKIAHDNGAYIIAICAGYQIIGNTFYADNIKYDGLGLLDIESYIGDIRAIGDIMIDSNAFGIMSGFENHMGRTRVLSGNILGNVKYGIGNDGVIEGVFNGRIYGTYMHGPFLARNIYFADMLIKQILKTDKKIDFNVSFINLYNKSIERINNMIKS